MEALWISGIKTSTRTIASTYERREASDLNSVNTARTRYRWAKLALTVLVIIAAVAIVLWRLRG